MSFLLTDYRLQRLILVALSLLLLDSPSRGLAQGIPSGKGAGRRIEGTFRFVPVPYANYSRSLEFSLGFLPLAMFNPALEDTISPSSIAGALGLYTTNKSWFAMAFSKLFLDEDRWRLTAACGVGSVNFQFYLDNPIDNYVPYTAGAGLVFLEVQRRVIEDLYFGLNYVYLETSTSTEIAALNETAILRGVGLKATFDTRTNFYYPTSNFVTNLTSTAYPRAFGNEYVSDKMQLDYTHYFPFRESQDVLAARLYAGFGIGNLQFNQQFIVGRKDIRGYSQGKYRGDYILAMQGEYRWNFSTRWGAVGFLGFATVFGSLNTEDDGKILPGIGTGFRYTIITDTHMNVGMDIAAGRDDWGLYFRIGEAF